MKNRIRHKIALDEARELLGARSDYHLSQILGITRARVSQYRNRSADGYPDGYMDRDKVEDLLRREDAA